MNKLVFKSEDNNVILYSYYPNDDEFGGEVEYSKDTKEFRVVQRSENDETGSFGRKAALKISKMVSAGEDLPKEFIHAWG
jgi:hypothetical protein